MEFLIITGISGAGKSRTVSFLEDIGYYCVDNMPSELIENFYDLKAQEADANGKKYAVVIDIKGGESFYGFFEVLNKFKIEDKPYKILFLDASDDVVIRRYSEERKKHPLAENYKIAEAIELERKILMPIRERADFIIDNSNLPPSQLKSRLISLFLDNPDNSITVNCMSFGFKYGVPSGADTVIDVRCFPNPFYDAKLKELTGLDGPLKEFVLEKEDTQTFIKKFFDLYEFLLPLYKKEGKSQMVIAIGCTGGKHRSVALAQLLYEHLSKLGYRTNVYHRDIDKKLKIV
ncbi:nucleotide-binding protein [Clostridia bacterium]|nr:nucleotide-binding protein [Clostridia bacterium]